MPNMCGKDKLFMNIYRIFFNLILKHHTRVLRS